MTDTMFTRTALTEAAETAGVTTDQARTILEAAGVTVQPEPGWYLTEDGEVARVKPNKHTGALILHIDGDVLLPHQPWPKLTPARIVPVTAAPVTLTEDQVGELHEVARLKDPAGAGVMPFSRLQEAVRAIHTATVNAALAQHAAPAESEPIADAAKLIDPADVRKGDRVWAELHGGDEVTFTVTRVGMYGPHSRFSTYDFNTIRSVRLLHREEA